MIFRRYEVRRNGERIARFFMRGAAEQRADKLQAEDFLDACSQYQDAIRSGHANPTLALAFVQVIDRRAPPTSTF